MAALARRVLRRLVEPQGSYFSWSSLFAWPSSRSWPATSGRYLCLRRPFFSAGLTPRSWSVTCARRSSAHHGPDLATLGRLLIAVIVIGLFVAFSDRHPFCAGWEWLILGGVLGLGIGDIDDLLRGVELGVDTFDCAMPTRLGRHGMAVVNDPEKRWRIDLGKARFKHSKEPLMEGCPCPACAAGKPCFAYRVPARGQRFVLDTPGRTVVVADSNPMIEARRMGFNSESRVVNSSNHRGSGQNLLFSDGAIEWKTSPILTTSPASSMDNIWLPRDERGREVLELRSWPSVAADNFVSQ